MGQERKLADTHLRLAILRIEEALKVHPSVKLEVALWHLRQVNVNDIECNELPLEEGEIMYVGSKDENK